MTDSETLACKGQLTKPDLWIEIDLKALKENFNRIKALTHPQVQVLAVVKADAYGHGMVPVAKELQNSVSYFGVATLAEAMKLRLAGLSAPILIFGCIFPEEVSLVLEHSLTMTISDYSHAQILNGEAAERKTRAKVHIKVDTGMARLGIPYKRAREEIKRITELNSLVIEGLYTHFPIAEKAGEHFTSRQIEEFENLLKELEAEGINIRYRHAANSAGIVNFARSHLNLVRPGIMLYGLYPDPSLKEKIRLRPVLSLKTKVILLKNISQGESVSYGRTYLARGDTTIGVLPIGYSHGYPFALSGRAEVLYKGKRYPVAGRVCMDYTMVDFGQKTKVEVGEEVTLLGKEEEEEISAQELATKAQTIPYEIVCRLSPAIPRLYR